MIFLLPFCKNNFELFFIAHNISITLQTLRYCPLYALSTIMTKKVVAFAGIFTGAYTPTLYTTLHPPPKAAVGIGLDGKQKVNINPRRDQKGFSNRIFQTKRNEG